MILIKVKWETSVRLFPTLIENNLRQLFLYLMFFFVVVTIVSKHVLPDGRLKIGSAVILLMLFLLLLLLVGPIAKRPK